MAEQAASPAREFNRLLVFHADGKRYALPHDSVQEIVRPMQLARAPLAPEPLLGLGNLRGAVLPVVDLAALFGSKPSTDGDAGRILVMAGANPVGLRVDQVDDLVTIASTHAQTLEGVTDPAAPTSAVTLYHDADTGSLSVLDLAPLLAEIFPMRSVRTVGAAFVRRELAGEADAGAIREAFITFGAAGQEFALPIGSVLEVLSKQPRDHLARAGAAVISFRGRLLPRFSLHRLLGFEGDGEEDVTTIVVRISDADIALDVGEVYGIIRLAAADHEVMPGVLAGRGAEGRLQSVLKLDRGRRLISLLSPDHLFPEDMMNRIHRDASHKSLRDETITVSTRVFLVFRLDAQEYACPIEAVQEVSRLPEQITPAPHAPASLRGLSNLRGVVLPIVDQRARFGLPAVDGPASRLVVLSIGGQVTGFVVDAVVEVLRAPETTIMPSPLSLSADQPLSGVISLPEAARMILLLDPSRLLSTSEAELLGSYGKGEEAQPGRDQAPDRR